MSAAQAIASSRFLTAMGPMIEDEQKMNAVLEYIESIKVQPLRRPLTIDPDFKNKPMYTVEEYFDGLAKDLAEEWALDEAMKQGIPLEESRKRVEQVFDDHHLLTADEFIAQMEPRIRSMFK